MAMAELGEEQEMWPDILDFCISNALQKKELNPKPSVTSPIWTVQHEDMTFWAAMCLLGSCLRLQDACEPLTCFAGSFFILPESDILPGYGI